MPRRKKPPINPRNFEGQPDDYVLSVVLEDMDRANKYIDPVIDKLKGFYNTYNCILENKRESGANLFIPYVYSTVETAIPKILNAVFDAKPFISYKPVAADDEEKAETMTALIDYQMRQRMNAASEFYTIFKSAAIYGTAISKQTWKYETKKLRKRGYVETAVKLSNGKYQKTQKLGTIERDVVTYDAPVMKCVPLEQFRFDPAYTDIEESPWCCQIMYKELHELIEGEQQGIYKNTSKVAKDVKEQATIADKKGAMEDGVKLWEYWTTDWKVTVANENTVIECIRNPYFHGQKPFTKWVMVPMPDEFYGKSMVETLQDLQAELNTLRSQRIDNITFALNRMYLINKGADIDTSQLTSRPNGYIEVDDVNNDVKELPVADVTSSAYSDEEVVKADMDVTSGVHSYDRGQQAERMDTATVATLLTSASSERFKLQVMMMEENSMNKVGWQLAELNKQYLTDEVLIRVTQEGEETDRYVTFEDIDTDYDIVAVGTAIEPSVNKEVRQSQLIQLLNVASGVEGMNMQELMKRILQEFDFKDVDSMFVDQQQQMQQQVQQQAQPQEQQGNPQDGTDLAGIYPQVGGIGGMAQYEQNPIIQGNV